MIQISKMNRYWALVVIILFLLMPLLSFAEDNDPFSNTIGDFEENIQTTDEGIPDYATDLMKQMGDDIDTAVGGTPVSGLADQPVNTRYPITQYALQGLIKSPNKTQMMFVATDENTKFFLGLNDCLGLNCAYVTDIDKKGRVTFEDENGIYLFEVGQRSYLVERKGLIAPENAMFPVDLAQNLTDGSCYVPEFGVLSEKLFDLYVPEDICQCLFFNFWASMTLEDMGQYTLEVSESFSREFLGEEPDEKGEFLAKLAQATGQVNPGAKVYELPDITEEQGIRGAEDSVRTILKNKNMKAASLYCQETMGITENEATGWMLADNYIIAKLYGVFSGINIVDASDKEKEGIISIEGIATESEPSLVADTDTQSLDEDTIVSLNSELSEAENKIAVQEKQIDTLKNDLNSMLTSDTSDTDIQSLEDTIGSLNAELENKSTALSEAENQIAVQEKQIDTLKNDLNSMLTSDTSDTDIIQELRNTIATQEQTLSQQQENINQLQEELQNSSTSADTVASSDGADTQRLEDTIVSLNSELIDAENQIAVQEKQIDTLKNDLHSMLSTSDTTDSDTQRLEDTIASLNSELSNAENQNAIQEKQIDTLKNDLDSMLSDVNEKLNAKQELINDLESQLLTQSAETTSDTHDIKGDNLMVAREDVNIRENPSLNSTSIGVLLKDSTVSVEDAIQGWYKINIGKGGKEGYIYSPLDNKSNTFNDNDANTQRLEDTIASLNSELSNAENQNAIQEKQIDTLKNDLDSMLSDVNEKLNAKQELINDLKSQLLTQSTTEPSSAQEQNEQRTESTATQSTETTSDTHDIKGDNLMVAREDVNIREKPSPNSSIIGVLLKNSTVNVEDTVQGWHKIITKEGKDGYIYSPMLKEKK